MRQHKNTALVTPSVDERLLTTKELLQRVPLNRATIWRMVQEHRFPAPVQIAANRIVWRLSSILNWIAEREQHPIPPRKYYDIGGLKRGKEKPAASTEPVIR